MSGPTDHLSEAAERPWEQPGAWRMDCEPHRGPLLNALGGVALICGILSMLIFVLVPFALLLGIPVSVLARRDRRLMDAGLMDPGGRKETERAWHNGMSGWVFGACSAVIWGTLLLLAFPKQ